MNKAQIYLLLAFLVTTSCFCMETDQSIQTTVIHNGIGLGSVIAVVLSWERNKSILFAILHGIFSWLYVIYFALTR